MLKGGVVGGDGRRGRLLMSRKACSKRSDFVKDTAAMTKPDHEAFELSEAFNKVRGSVCSVALAATVIAGGVEVVAPPQAHADLRQSEYDRGGEFNRGSAKQFGYDNNGGVTRRVQLV